MTVILDRLHRERSDELEAVDRITDLAESDGRDLSDAERELIARHHTRVEELDPQIDQLEAVELQRARHNERVPARRPAPDSPEPAAPGGELGVYRTFAQYARDAIVARYDAVAQLAGGPVARAAAEQRLERVIANTLSSDVPGLMPAQYLTQIAEVIDKSRPIVQSARSVGLSSGKLSYPSITSRPQVGKQTAEKTEAPSRKMSVVFVDVVADTYVGAGDLSWQAINWSTPDALSLWFDLAAEQYAIQTEAAAGTVLAAVTASAATIPLTPTLADFMSAIVTAAGEVFTASRRHADTLYMDVASGYRFMGLVSNVSPVFIPAGGFSLGSGQGVVGGLRLVLSAGLPAKTMVVGASSSLLVAETPGSPVELRAVEPAIGGMEVGIIGAFACKVTDGGAFRKIAQA